MKNLDLQRLQDDMDLQRFQDTLDKTFVIDAMRKGFKATEACKMLGVSAERYCNWFNNDVEFRVQMYAAIKGVSVEAYLATPDD
jgi:hypothetical protein